MNLKDVFLTTLIPEFPRIYSYNNQVFKRYLDVIYSETQGVVIVPVNTTGRVKASTGEFVTTITDNLIVKKQWTNMYSNTNTADSDYYYAYIGGDAPTRDASTMGTLEKTAFKYVDVLKTYYKITNDISTAFASSTLGQEIQLLFDPSTATSAPFHVLLNPSIGGSYKMLSVTKADSSLAWVKLLAVNYDASWGTTWTIKQFGGTIHVI